MKTFINIFAMLSAAAVLAVSCQEKGPEAPAMDSKITVEPTLEAIADGELIL